MYLVSNFPFEGTICPESFEELVEFEGNFCVIWLCVTGKIEWIAPLTERECIRDYTKEQLLF